MLFTNQLQEENKNHPAIAHHLWVSWARTPTWSDGHLGYLW